MAESSETPILFALGLTFINIEVINPNAENIDYIGTTRLHSALVD